MKNIYFLFTILLSLSTYGLFAEGDHSEEHTPISSHDLKDYTPLSSYDLKYYHDKLEAQVDKTNEKLHQLKAKLHSPSFEPALHIEIKHTFEMLKVKETLVEEFDGKDSLRSEAVRNELLEVISKPEISHLDLNSLQHLVNSEKKNISQFDAEKKKALEAAQKRPANHKS